MEIRLLLGVGLAADTVVGDIGGEQVWLKPVFLDGKQIGVDACCPAAAPCAWHAGLRQLRRWETVGVKVIC